MDTLKMALIGAGTWGKTHANLYTGNPAVQLTGICDSDISRAAALAEACGLPEDAAFASHTEMLDSIDCDAVAIVTPDFLHRKLAVDCAERKKHILLEKPLATTREDIYAILDAVKAGGIRMMVDLHNRWSPPFALTKQAIDKGEIGTPIHAYFRLNDIKWVATDMLKWSADSSILWFLGSHSFDTLRWMFSDEVDSVYAVSHTGVLQNQGIDTEDVFQSILKFKRGGIATMENGWITPNGHPNINDLKFNIVGEKGMFSLDLSNSQMIEQFSESRSERPDILVKHFVHGKPRGFSYESIRDFTEKILTGDPFLVSLKDAANTSLGILAILESAQTGKVVHVESI